MKTKDASCRWLALLVCVMLAAIGAFRTAPASHRPLDGEHPPNIVLIVADDLGFHELGCYGQEKIRTPGLDRLAREGMRFTQARSGAPVCAPSRCVLMTAMHTGHADIRGNKEVGGWGPEEPEGQWPIPDELITLPELLKQRGYNTGAFGKWGLGGPGSEGHPCNQGFDHFYGYLCQRVAHNYYPTHLWRNHDIDVLHGNDHFRAHQRIAEPLQDESAYEQFAGEDYAPTEILDETKRWIGQQSADTPFFLFYPSVIPHLALQAPQEWIDQYPREWDKQHYLGNNGYLPAARPNATYAAMISYLDYIVGEIVNSLDQQGLLENTIILFTSDNGTTYVGGVDRAFFNSLGELRGHKGNLFEGGIKVPMIAWWPGRIQADSASDHLCSSQDLLPTLVELAGGESPDGIDGISFAPTLLGNAATQRQHEYLYWEHPEGNQQQAVIVGRYKAIRTNLRNGNMTIMLFDLEADPNERNDIAAEHPELVAKFERIMREAREPSELFPINALDESEQ